jgi:hypothetical protein
MAQPACNGDPIQLLTWIVICCACCHVDCCLYADSCYGGFCVAFWQRDRKAEARDQQALHCCTMVSLVVASGNEVVTKEAFDVSRAFRARLSTMRPQLAFKPWCGFSPRHPRHNRLDWIAALQYPLFLLRLCEPVTSTYAHSCGSRHFSISVQQFPRQTAAWAHFLFSLVLARSIDEPLNSTGGCASASSVCKTEVAALAAALRSLPYVAHDPYIAIITTGVAARPSSCCTPANNKLCCVEPHRLLLSINCSHVSYNFWILLYCVYHRCTEVVNTQTQIDCARFRDSTSMHRCSGGLS